ncbi:MAG: ATP-binding protein [Gordonia sp. (in: high G+C Gram-positive bacteria)]|uniref:sensor histidine kinase n=1 Tax=Gordonia sp. (in: high G+C Gram-positive bacteria) TaxID=84139 RepID=UPI0039E54100
MATDTDDGRVRGAVVNTASSAPAITGGREQVRILTVMTRFVGVGYFAYFLISVPAFGQPPGLVADWYTPLAAVLAFAPGFVLFAVTFRRDAPRGISAVAAACPVGYLAAAALWFVAWTGERSSVELISWLMPFSGLPALAVALTRLGPALVIMVLCGVAGGAVTTLGRVPEVSSNIVFESIWGPLFVLSFMLASRLVVRTGQTLDETRADALEAAARTAAVAAGNAERARFDALIHDRVIATLIAAKDVGDTRLPGQARAALDELAALAGGPDDKSEVSAAETVARLRTMAASIDVDVPVGEVEEEALDTGVPRYPAAAVRAIAEAMGEALRNAMIHAGPEAEHAVLIEPWSDSLLVTVADNGAGFDPAAVAPERLGIEVSIRSRMGELPGGSAELRSAPGQGTTVRIRWAAE